MVDESTREWFRRFLRHEPELRTYLRRFLTEPADIADVVQDSYARLLQLSDSQRTRIHSPRAFMFTTAHNVAVDRLRRRPVVSLDAMAELDASIVLQETGYERTLDDELSTRQELERLERVLAALPKRCGEVLRLRKVFGFSQAEIAAELGITEHTVEKQLARALRLCADLMATDLPQSGGGALPRGKWGRRRDVE
jgi:RNA polymerase sigma factor (sigma-70 family)